MKEKQFHIKLSDTMQVCGVEERRGERRGRQIARSVCVNGWRGGGGGGAASGGGVQELS